MSEGIEIVFRRDLGGTECTFAVSKVAVEGIDEMADVLSKATDRQYAKLILRETLVDFLAAKKSLDQHSETVRAYQRGRAADRATMIAAYQATYPEGRRTPFTLSKAQREQLHSHDVETEKKLQEFAEARTKLQETLPDLEMKIARLRQRIEGADMLEMLEAERQSLLRPVAEAAD